MQIEIITPDAKLFSGEVSLVQFPGKDGSFEVLKDHAPLISVLKKGKIKLMDPNKQLSFYEIKGGIVEVKNNKIIVLAD